MSVDNIFVSLRSRTNSILLLMSTLNIYEPIQIIENDGIPTPI